MRLTAIAKFEFRPFAAIRAGDQQHVRVLVRDSGGRCLVDQATCGKALQCEWRADGVWLAGCQLMREDMAGAGGRLEAARSPAAIDEEAGNRRLADDRRA